jgi:hypothetical protein
LQGGRFPEVRILAQPSSVLNRSLLVIRKRFLRLWWAAAWPYLVMGTCFLIYGLVLRAFANTHEPTDPVTLWNSLGWLTKLGLVLYYLASISLPPGFAAAGVTSVVWAEAPSVGEKSPTFVPGIRPVFLRLVAVSLCIGAACAMTSMFFLVPGILAFAILSFVIPVLVIENTTIGNAVRRGFDLAWARVGALVGLYAVVTVIAIGITIVAAIPILGITLIPSTMDVPWWVLPITFLSSFTVLASILMMASTTVVVHLYRDVREARGEFALSAPPGAVET